MLFLNEIGVYMKSYRIMVYPNEHALFIKHNKVPSINELNATYSEILYKKLEKSLLRKYQLIKYHQIFE